jgi:hypothetical protein
MNTIICPNCGADNPASIMNCRNCRINLEFALEHSDPFQAAKREAASIHHQAPTQPSGLRTTLLVIRWAARLASLFFIGAFILMFLGEGFDTSKVTPREWVSLLFFPFGAMLGLILAWWKEGLGGAISLGSLLANYIVGDVSSAGGGYQLICVSPAFLFLLCWFLAREADAPAAGGRAVHP